MIDFIIHQLLISMKCIHCKDKELTGRQTRFCGPVCKNRYLNSWHNSASKQKQRGLDKKIKLLKLLGEVKCSKCGYDKNFACLSFHHRKPIEKKFSLDQRACSMYSMDRLTVEAKKCQVLCLNCHSEHHNPQHKNGWLYWTRTSTRRVMSTLLHL